jgi:Right handed beta helix region
MTDMTLKKAILLLISAVICLWSTEPVGGQQRGGRPQTLQVPSDRFPTIQSAINFAAAGDRILIAPGVYNETLTIAKRITLTGSGARGERQTAIVGPRPTEVVPIERAIGVVNYQPGGGGKIEDLLIRGGDGAGILGAAIEERFPAALEVKQVIIHQGVRGIAGSFSDLTVQDSKVGDMLWHGVSIVKAKGHISFDENFIAHCMGLGFFSGGTGANVSLLNDTFGVNAQGGILVVGANSVYVTKCYLYANRVAGIWLKNVSFAALCHNLVKLTQNADGYFGDGITVQCSENVIVCQDNQNFALDYLPPGIEDSARAGISSFGSNNVSLFNVKIACSAFDLDIENLSGCPPPSFFDGGGLACGCPDANGSCLGVSSQLTPAEPPGP